MSTILQRSWIGLACGLLMSALPSRAAESEVVYATDFDSPEALEGWSGIDAEGVRIAPGREGTKALSVWIPPDEGPGTRGARRSLPLEALRGTRVRVEASVRAEGVSKPPHPWNGIEVMLHTAGPGGQRWDQQNDVHGTFDWKTVRFLSAIPDDATSATLILGLEQVTGRAWIDDVKVTVIRRQRSAAKPIERGSLYRGHDLPRLRGAMIGPRVGADDLRELGLRWKANHVRWQLIWGGFPHGPADDGDLEAYERWVESELARLDSLLPVCEEAGILVLIDLHTPPGGRNASSECNLFKEARFQECFLKVWEGIAARYRGKKSVWGYDLVNEPVEGVLGEGVMDWHALATEAARRVREIDPEHAIVVEPAPWGSPSALDFFEPIDVERVVYSVHMYQPHSFTHQGVYDTKAGIVYPGEIDGRYWDKDALRRALEPAVDYQRDYGVHIYVGEFSAIRWAPGTSARDYLRDVIEILEENEWDWAYHAFREWDGWSVEHGPDRANRSRASEPTDRQRLLWSWFEKNEKNEKNEKP